MDTTALAHRSDPETSHVAAASLNQAANSAMKAAILDILAERPRAAFEVTGAYFARRTAHGWPDSKTDGIAKRLSELRVAGRIVDSGERHRTQFGRPAVVWALADPVPPPAASAAA
jgi:hypothetical protein